MKYKNTKRLYCRKPDQPRKDYSINNNLGNSYEIKNKEVIFIGKKEEPYCLTKNKKYVVLNTSWGKSCYDEILRQKFKNSRRACQTEENFIIIINDKGNKRKYSHLMFKNET